MSTEITAPVHSPPGMPTTISLPDGSPQTKSRKLPPHRKYAKKFLTLPNEILLTISNAVDPEDLPYLRLTCKTLNDVSGKSFGEKRLAHRRFMFTEYSMNGLVELTAHPVFGPCVKSIMFSTHHLSNSMRTLLNTVRSKNLSDDEAMKMLRLIVGRYNKHRIFAHSTVLSSMLQAAFVSLATWGTSVSLGFFDDVQPTYRGSTMLHGFGFTDAYQGLPFLNLTPSYQSARQFIASACRATNFRVASLMVDLHGQQDHNGMRESLLSLLLSDGRLQNINYWIKMGSVDIGILSSQNRLEFKQITEFDGWLSVAENCRFELISLGKPMRVALFSWPFAVLHMESCSTYVDALLYILQSLADNLRVVELIEVAVWGEQNPGDGIDSLLSCLRDDMQLQTLVLDEFRAMNKDYSGDTGIDVAIGRSWHGQAQICQGLSVFIDFGTDSWDGDDLDDYLLYGLHSKEEEERFQKRDDLEAKRWMEPNQYLEHEADRDRRKEERIQEFKKYRIKRDSAQAAMAAVEALKP
ncbi:hypothetical protein D6C81_05869 [Aureobasidium pullulans]|nr:hypothetical protein D6C81_05869 [Aureobasidium pullulans]